MGNFDDHLFASNMELDVFLGLILNPNYLTLRLYIIKTLDGNNIFVLFLRELIFLFRNKIGLSCIERTFCLVQPDKTVNDIGIILLKIKLELKTIFNCFP